MFGIEALGHPSCGVRECLPALRLDAGVGAGTEQRP